MKILKLYYDYTENCTEMMSKQDSQILYNYYVTSTNKVQKPVTNI